MNFIIMNRQEARRYSFKYHDEKSIIISINDECDSPNRFDKNVYNRIVDICTVYFDDVESHEKNCIKDTDGIQIANFVNRYRDSVDTIIVHCNAGVSRSAGVCAAIMKYITGDDMQIFNSFKYCPNMICYRTVLQALLGPSDKINETEIKDKFQYNLSIWVEHSEITQ